MSHPLQTSISILIPAFMESDNLPSLIDSLSDTLSEAKFEVIIVDDNSPDGTAEKIVEQYKIHDNIKVLVRPNRMGLGSAYKDGFMVSSGKIIAQMDADLSHNPKDLLKLVNALSKADLVIGSRNTKGGRTFRWKPHRKLISICINFLVKHLLRLHVADSTSGFKVYKRDAFEQIVKSSLFDGFEFQVESIYIAQKLGLRMSEVPITFSERKHGKSKLSLWAGFNFAKAVLKLAFVDKVQARIESLRVSQRNLA